ncbi:DsbA family protein [Candidatus Uhrbacteria bacterium]|nr:DsbA family protein [Candidatus Uhrbacteria bacterium]
MRPAPFLLATCILVGGAALYAMRPPTRPAPVSPVSPSPTAPATTPRSPSVLPTDPIRGSANAPHTVIIFSDFTCPSCADAAQALQSIYAAHPSDVRIVWKDLPILDRITGSRALHIAARCAQQEGKFWEFHDAFFAARPANARMIDALRTAHQINPASFEACRKGASAAERVDANKREAAALRLTGTPTLFIDGTPMPHAITAANITDALRTVRAPY